MSEKGGLSPCCGPFRLAQPEPAKTHALAEADCSLDITREYVETESCPSRCIGKVRRYHVSTGAERNEDDLSVSIAETLEILADGELMAALRASIRAIKGGDTYTSEEIRAWLGL